MEDNKNRRHNYYISKEFQRSFILKFCLIVLAGSAVTAAIIFLVSGATVTTSFDNLRLVIKSTADYILPSVILSSVMVIIITVIATIFITLFTSHRIAGPLYRIEKDVQEVMSGNLKKGFSLRQGDEIIPIANALDSMNNFLKTEIGIIKEKIVEVEMLAQRGGGSEELKEKIKELKEAAGKFKT
jgi:methyl-accepting chemotaxis protein